MTRYSLQRARGADLLRLDAQPDSAANAGAHCVERARAEHLDSFQGIWPDVDLDRLVGIVVGLIERDGNRPALGL